MDKKRNLRLDLAALYRFEKATGINLLLDPGALGTPNLSILLEFVAACAAWEDPKVNAEVLASGLGPEKLPELLSAIEKLWREAAPPQIEGAGENGGAAPFPTPDQTSGHGV
ncbi:MAG: hypothetical protein QXW98_04835 [Candidatus Caldarchaeum sp.]